MTEEELRASLPEHLRRCGVPGDIVRRVLEPPRPTSAGAAVDEWRGTDERTLVLLGGVGCGKSFAAASALAQNVIGYRVFLRTPGDLPPDWRWNGGFFCEVRSQLGDPKASYEHVVAVRERAKRTSLLVLDDLGTEKGDGEEAIWSIVTARHAEQRTVLTSNLSEPNFRARYGGRLLSRILGSGRLRVVHGPDLRQRQEPLALGSAAP